MEKNKRQVLTLTFLAIALAGSVFLVQKVQETRRGAAGTSNDCLSACLTRGFTSKVCRYPGTISGDTAAKCYPKEEFAFEGICANNSNCCCYGKQ